MPDFPRLAEVEDYEANIPPAITGGIVVTGSASANVKGAWVELIRSTSADGSFLHIQWGTSGSVNTEFLLDIGIGPAGSEQVIVPNLYCSRTTTSGSVGHIVLPIAVPAGARISARVQGATASVTPKLTVRVGSATMPGSSPAAGVDAFGADTTDTSGAAMDAGAVANTRSAWTELVRSTPREYLGLFMCFGNNKDVARTFADFDTQIGIGAAGSEVVLISDILAYAEGADDLIFPCITPLMPVHIPAGSRLSQRVRSSNTTAGDRTLDSVLYGVY